MSLKVGQKVNRVVDFIMGLRHPTISSLIGHHGFTQQDLDEGWKHLREVAGERLSLIPVTKPQPDAIERLDQWENKWFPIIQASLQYNFPEIHDQVFLNLSRTDGPELVISVAMLIQRIEALRGGGEGRDDAFKLIQHRGLSDEKLTEIKQVLENASSLVEPPVIDLEKMRAAQKEAEDRMWGWYSQWRTIARSAIKDRRLLRQLGIITYQRDVPEDIEEAEAEAAMNMAGEFQGQAVD